MTAPGSGPDAPVETDAAGVRAGPGRGTGTRAGAAGGADTAERAAGVRGGVGIVIPLPEPLRSELQRIRASFGDPLAETIPPHITLVTGAATDDWERTRGHVRAVSRRWRTFELTLRGSGSFRPVSPVIYLKVDRGWDECVGLHRQLQSGPLDGAPEFDYHPHLTVAHDIAGPAMDRAQASLRGYEAGFTVERIGLFEYASTGQWSLQEELALGTHGPATR